MNRDLGDYRKSYEKEALLESNIPKDPLELFTTWFKSADANDEVEEPNAMTLSTNGLDGYPRNRVVLLKQFNQDGFVFYTNYESEKGRAISVNNKVCLSFFWPAEERQVIIKGMAERVSDHQSLEYFKSRPKGSQLGALVSNQSQPIANRQVLEDALQALEKNYASKVVPKPKHWGGFRVIMHEIEFWQGRKNRLHDRIRYQKESDLWQITRLAP